MTAKNNKKVDKAESEVLEQEQQPVLEPVMVIVPDDNESPITAPNTEVDAMLQAVTDTMESPSPDLENTGVEGEAPTDIYSDASGDIWDNTKHATGADGKPIYTVKGLFRKRRSYKGRGQEPAEVVSRKVAEYSALAYTQLGVAIFGEEWQPIVNAKEDEREMLITAFDDYFALKGVVDIPAGLGLSIALGGYAIRRVGKPQTKSRLGNLKGWLKGKLSKVRIRKPKQAQKQVQI